MPIEIGTKVTKRSEDHSGPSIRIGVVSFVQDADELPVELQKDPWVVVTWGENFGGDRGCLKCFA
jgi:hypothetical protein